jgi:hypothetical protein
MSGSLIGGAQISRKTKQKACRRQAAVGANIQNKSMSYPQWCGLIRAAAMQ